MSNPERAVTGPERGTETAAEAAGERAAELLKLREQSGEKHAERTEHRIAAERKELEAVFSKENGAAELKSGRLDGSPHSPRKTAGKTERKAAYKRTMKRIRSEMSPSQRVFSKVIHNPVIDKASSVMGNTVARPNAILAGSFSAFILVTLVYVIAKNYGYPLSGFETIAAFIIGWISGTLFDFMRTMITGKR